jgi:hypothetical protein
MKVCLSNYGIQPTALRAAADTKRWAHTGVTADPSSSSVGA